MPDKEKVIKALEYCTHSDDCLGCIHWQKVVKGEKCTVREDALALLKEQQQQIWEFQDQVEYLTDKLKEQEKKGKNRLPYSSDSNVQWT